jgi:hypothetical protein
MPIVADEHDNPVLWNLIFAARGSDVNMVFVDGECLVEQEKTVNVSEEDVLDLSMHQTH